MRYRKRAVVVEAWLNILDNDMPEWVKDAVSDVDDGALLIGTLEGTMRAEIGDFVIRGVDDEVYPCKPDIFWKTHEQA